MHDNGFGFAYGVLVRNLIKPILSPKMPCSANNSSSFTAKSTRPSFSQSDRLWFVLLASRVKNWRNALLVFKPDTPLCWHRQGFRLFWNFKSRNRGGRPKLATETVALIQQMAQQNRLWGAERIRGELLKLDLSVAKHTIQKHIARVRPAKPSAQT